MTRRRWIAIPTAAAAALAAASANAQQTDASAAKPTREQDLENARAGIRNNAEALAKVKVPQSIEPAFQFKAG